MRSESRARIVNGFVSAVIVVLFLAHSALGGVAVLTGFTSPFSVLVWAGVALIAAHVVVSIVTSFEQLNDAERPPSARKKRHLALKWATGALLTAVAIAHVVLPKSAVMSTVVVIALAAALAVHLCVGSKSLLKDLGVDRRYKMAFRVVVCVICACAATCVLVAVLL